MFVVELELDLGPGLGLKYNLLFWWIITLLLLVLLILTHHQYYSLYRSYAGIGCIVPFTKSKILLIIFYIVGIVVTLIEGI